MMEIARRVLWVEDEVEVLKFARSGVVTLMGWEIVATTDPVAALESAIREDFDLFVFDLQLPKIDGGTLYECIAACYRHHPGGPRRLPPLLVASAHGREREALDLFRIAGVRGLLPKPFNLQRLVESLESCLPSSGARLN